VSDGAVTASSMIFDGFRRKTVKYSFELGAMLLLFAFFMRDAGIPLAAYSSILLVTFFFSLVVFYDIYRRLLYSVLLDTDWIVLSFFVFIVYSGLIFIGKNNLLLYICLISAFAPLIFILGFHKYLKH
jgi:hypothetical protein